MSTDTITPEEIGIDFSKHPCFSRDAHHKFGRIHLPVAPRCNIQCNFCNRKFDCMNESRPGVTSAILKPWQAVDYLDEMLAKRPEIAVLGIAGPGDPFANSNETMETLRLARARHPGLILCLASNGLGIVPYIDELAELKTSHVTITINALDPTIGAEIYAWVRENKTPLRGLHGAALLLERQLEAIRKLKEKNIVVKTNTIIIPGINDEHIPTLAKHLQELGVDIMNCMPLIPVKGAAFEDMTEPDRTMVARRHRRSARRVQSPWRRRRLYRAPAARYGGALKFCLDESSGSDRSGRAEWRQFRAGLAELLRRFAAAVLRPADRRGWFLSCW